MTTLQYIEVVAVVLDVNNLTIFKKNGETIIIPQGDSRLAPILERCEDLQTKPSVFVPTDLLMEPKNSYVHYEETSESSVKFFRVAKEALKSLFGIRKKKLPNTVLGSIPPTPKPEAEDALSKAVETSVKQAIQEIMRKAIPANSPEFHDKKVGDEGNDTIIAVVNDQVIPNVQMLKAQIKNSVVTANPKGMDRFLQRLSLVIQKRQHSVEDLLRFMERNDLPIADDGSIIIYKTLTRKEQTINDIDFKYVDVHTGKVPQKVGSYVCMNINLVDSNRQEECSNGLHVARRGYIGGFGGNVCVLAKVNPEDVIAVPAYDSNKMRVCGYHILFELSEQDHQNLKNDQPFTVDTQGQTILGNALTGNHVPILERVEITQHLGEGIKITKTEVGNLTDVVVPVQTVTANNLDIDDKEEIKVDKVVPQELGRKAKAKALYAAYLEARSSDEAKSAAEALMALKKKSKQSWVALDLPENLHDDLQAYLD